MLFIDSREKAPIKELMAFTAGPATVLALACADFLILDKCGHSLGIERKAVSDLLGSFGSKNLGAKENRVSDAIARMQATYTHVMLLVEGRLQFNVITKRIITGQRHSGWNHGSIQQKLWAVQATGVTVMVMDDKYATGDWLRILHNKSLAGCVLPQALRDIELEELVA